MQLWVIFWSFSALKNAGVASVVNADRGKFNVKCDIDLI